MHSQEVSCGNTYIVVDRGYKGLSQYLCELKKLKADGKERDYGKERAYREMVCALAYGYHIWVHRDKHSLWCDPNNNYPIPFRLPYKYEIREMLFELKIRAFIQDHPIAHHRFFKPSKECKEKSHSANTNKTISEQNNLKISGR